MNRTRACKVGAKWYNNASTALNRVLPSLYHDYVGNRYYNSADGETAFPFTATRTTNAMQFDALGRLVWAPTQHCTRGNDFTTGWSSDGSVSLSGNTAPTGMPAYTHTYATTATYGLGIGNLPVVLGAPYTASIYLRYINHQWTRIVLYSLSNTANQIRVFVDLLNKVIGTADNGGGSGTLIGASVTDAGGGWVRVSVSGYVPFTSATTDANILVTTCIGNGNTTRVGSGAAFEVSSCLVEPWSAATPSAWRSEFATTGAAWYGPRFDYDPVTLQPRGILIEESRTNLIANSNGTSGWVITDVTPSKTLTGIERVENTAYLMTEGSAGTSVVTPAGTGVTVTAGATITVSGIFKYQNCQWLRIQAATNTGVDGWKLWVDVQNGIIGTGSAIGAGTFVSSRVTNLGDGWFRFELTATPNASYTSAIFQILSASGDGSNTRVGGAAWGIQWPMLEDKTFASLSIIPTYGGATATRASDNLSVATTGWINTTRGTIYGKVYRSGNFPGGTIANIGNSGGSSERNQIRLNGATASHIITVGGVVQSTSATSVTATAGQEKVAYRYAAGAQMICYNGTLSGAPGNCPALPTTQDTLHVGQLNSSTEKANFWIQELRYYADNSASNAQLQALTT